MVRRSILLSLLASAGGFLSSEARKTSEAKVVPGSYVVEFEESKVFYPHSLGPFAVLF
jgi:hypothetical protein